MLAVSWHPRVSSSDSSARKGLGCQLRLVLEVAQADDISSVLVSPGVVRTCKSLFKGMSSLPVAGNRERPSAAWCLVPS